MTRRTIVLLLLTLLLYSCQQTEQTQQAFETAVKPIQERFVPDKSLDVFSPSLSYENGSWQLSGEVSVEAAVAPITAVADSLLGVGTYTNSLITLPEAALGDSSLAIVTVSVAHLRDHPRHSAQLVDQSIMGRELKILKRGQGGWYLIQTEYGYVGWMRRESFFRTDEAGLAAWRASNLVRVNQVFSMARSQKNDQSDPVTDLVLNAVVAQISESDGWSKVATPGGKTGFVRTVYLSHDLAARGTRGAEAVLATARSMLGVPYLWGGNSSKGNDCSGFTQTVFKANGLQLLRDARQQIREGETVEYSEDFSNVMPGDLLFFGSTERITHVGISMGGHEFIHQSGVVEIRSLNPGSELYSEYRRNSLQKIKRVL